MQKQVAFDGRSLDFGVAVNPDCRCQDRGRDPLHDEIALPGP
jgi:hypothetical protein